MDSKIDLKRMENLLNKLNSENINYHENIHLRSKNKERKLKIDLLATKDEALDFRLDHIDIEDALASPGKVVGFNNIVNINSLYDDIITNIPIEYFNNAKYVLCNYFVSEDLTVFQIIQLFKIIEDEISNNEIELIFGVTQLKDLEINEVGYRILLTGIKDEDNEELSDSNLTYHRQLYNENHMLKNKTNHLQEEIQRLKDQNSRLKSSIMSLTYEN